MEQSNKKLMRTRTSRQEEDKGQKRRKTKDKKEEDKRQKAEDGRGQASPQTRGPVWTETHNTHLVRILSEFCVRH
ncbi:hypothetical protein Q5P01_023345 [Channa striata]|uniref:Uncharacterized protein n=1 Tax=Channa striata TaxID=64152 RepID=A0AA88LQW4_CHASR|nr:hypothetical protein Q5P01_023345 [Channa striata]